MEYAFAALIAFGAIILAIILRPLFLEARAKMLWDKYQQDAEWDRYDYVDPPYCWACIVTLDVDGFHFYGEGQIVCGTDYEIESIECVCPDGRTVKIV